MRKQKTKDMARGPGAPSKPQDRRKGQSGLLPEQWKRIKEEASIRNISEAAVLREAVDWYFTAKDTKRGDVEASKMFDVIEQ